MPVALLRMDNNLPPWRSGLKEVILSLSVLSLLYLWHISRDNQFMSSVCIRPDL